MAIRYEGSAPVPKAFADHLTSVPGDADSREPDILFTRYDDAIALRTALTGAGALARSLRPGAIVIDQSTCEPTPFRLLAKEIADQGIRLMEAPLSGHLSAESGCGPILLYACPDDLRAVVAPLLERIYGRVFHCGETGAAHAMNLLNAGLGLSTQVATLEVAAMGRRFGLGVGVMADVVSKGSGRNRASTVVMPRLAAGSGSSDMTLAAAVRVLEAASREGMTVGAPMLAAGVAGGLLRAALNRYGPDASIDRLVHLVESMASTSLRDPEPSVELVASDAGPLRVGYVGLGAMGGALARRLLLSRPLTVYDVNPSTVAAMVRDGAVAAPDAASLARDCDVIMTCVPTSAIARQAIFGPGGLAEGLSPGKIAIDQTTGDPAETVAIARDLNRIGVEMIDAPVSGGTRGAVAGTIAIICGGPSDTFARVAPLLGEISPNIVHCGGIGTGHAAKLVQNAVAACNRAITLECVAAAFRGGLSLDQMIEPVVAGSGWNGGAERIIPALRDDSPTTDFAMGLMVKDLKLACAIGSEFGAPMMVPNIVRGLFQTCANERGADKNLDEIAQTVGGMAGVAFSDHADQSARREVRVK